ncbi:MAG TPA: hypothetical protein PKI19_09485 [Elusimicrobiales bacterium]|nr:hypothetical protein [Elusimicrobiales bacterium]
MDREEEKGELVETGTFRVDTERMLAVLAKYRLQSPLQAVHELVRCAVLSGAPELVLAYDYGREGKGFQAGFEAPPLAAEELADIYSPLLAGCQDRRCHLASAVLALSATGPARMTLTSGGRSVELVGAAAAGPGYFPVAGTRTTLRVLWRGEPPGLPLERIVNFPVSSREALACCPIKVRSEAGESQPFELPAPQADALGFRSGGRLGTVAPLLEDGSAALNGAVPAALSTLGLHAAGVYVETEQLELPLAPLAADICDGALLLDTSFSKCVRDENFSALRPFLEKEALRLLVHETKVQQLDMRSVSGLLKYRKYRDLWRARMDNLGAWKNAVSEGGPLLFLADLWRFFTTRSPAEYETGYFENPPPEKLALIGRTGPRTWWLQDACRRALARRPAAGQPEPDCLRTVPLLFSQRGEPLSLADLQKRAKDGKLKVSGLFGDETGWEGSEPPDNVWLPSARDTEFLRGALPGIRWDES